MNVLSALLSTIRTNINRELILNTEIIDILGLEGNVLLVVKKNDIGTYTYHQLVSVNIKEQTIDLKAGTGPNTVTYNWDEVSDLKYTCITDCNGYWSILALRGNYDLCHKGYRVLAYVPKLELYLKHVIVEITITNALLGVPDVYVLVVDDTTEPLEALASFMSRLPNYILTLNKQCSYVVHNTMVTRIQRSNTFKIVSDAESISLDTDGVEICKTEVLATGEFRALCKSLEPAPTDTTKSKPNKRFKKPYKQPMKSNEAVM